MRRCVYISCAIVMLVCLGVYGVDGLNPPRNIRALSNLNSRVYLAWDAPEPSVSLVEISYDDGIPRGLDPGQPGDIVSVRFSPDGPCTLKQVRIFVFAPLRPDTVEFHIWLDDGTGYPALFVGDIISPIRCTISGSYSWFELDLSSQRIYLNGDDFHIGLVKIDTSFYYNILVDSSPSVPPRSFLFSMRDFDFYPIAGDLMIRAYVKPVSSHLVDGAHKKIRKFRSEFQRFVFPKALKSPILTYPERLRGYNIYRSVDPFSGFYYLAFTESLHYNDMDVRNDSTYYYKVSALYDDGESEYAGPVAATPRGSDGVVYDTLMYDPGVPTFAISWVPNCRIGNRFSFPVLSKLVGVETFVYVRGRIRHGIYRVNDDVVETEAYFVMPSADSARTTGWNYADLERFNIFLSGEFVISVNFEDLALSIGGFYSPGADFSYDFEPERGYWTNLADTVYFIRAITSYSYSTARIRLYPGWNMVSLPVVPANRDFRSLFPFAVPPAFRYNPITRSYVAVDSLVEGEGYFILSFSERLYEINGIPVRSYDLPVRRGWNMIGAISSPDPLPNSSLLALPSMIVSDPRLYYFNTRFRRYESRTNLIAGEGYYIYVNGDGIIRVR